MKIVGQMKTEATCITWKGDDSTLKVYCIDSFLILCSMNLRILRRLYGAKLVESSSFVLYLKEEITLVSMVSVDL